MTGDKKSSDLSGRLSVKRGGKLISKTLGKSSSPPSISAPPEAAVGASKVKKDEVQRPKNSFHDMIRGSSKDKDGGRIVPLSAAGQDALKTAESTICDVDLSSVEVPTAPDKDILELEKALAAARDETAVLRQQLERVKQDAQASVEISKYQAETHQPATSEDAMMYETHEEDFELHIQTRELEEDIIDQNHDLRYRFAELQDQLAQEQLWSHSIPLAQAHPSDNLHSDADWDALILRLHETEKESQARLKQLLTLKSSISSLTRTDSQISDSELADSFSQLANRVREWVVSNYKRTKLDFSNVSPETVEVLRLIKHDFENTGGADKLALFQAIVSHTLMQIFDEPIIVGLPRQDVFVGVRGFAATIQDAGAGFRKWRRATIRVIEHSELGHVVSTEKATELQRLANKLERILLPISSTELTSSARLALGGILNTAADLQYTLCLQKAEYRILFFSSLKGQDHHFDNRTMEPVNDLEYVMDDGNDLYTKRKFIFCVFPCLKKLGNDTSHSTGMINVVAKARVCCGVG